MFKINKISKAVVFVGSVPPGHSVNRTYIRHSEDILNVFSTSYVRSMYVLHPISITNFEQVIDLVI